MDKDDYFLKIAETVSIRSSCSRRKVGAILVKDGHIISTGYNGTPKGLLNCDQGGCNRALNPSITLTESMCCHAEENAIVQAAHHGISVKGSTIYTIFSPCVLCSKMIINAGISRVVYQIGRAHV